MPKKLFGLCLCVLLTSCGQYKNHFRDRGNDYVHAVELPPLQFPQGMNALPASDYYRIPSIVGELEAIELLPPDFQRTLR